MILEALDVYYSSGCDLLKAKKVAPGFFYKQLRRPYYESGSGQCLVKVDWLCGSLWLIGMKQVIVVNKG